MLITDCTESPDVCCIDLFAIANHILSNVYDSLLPCFANVECEPLSAYVTLGNGDDGVTDALSIAIVNVAPSQGSQPGGALLQLPLTRAQFNLRLLESGWPTASVEGGVITAPNPVIQNEAARQAYAHGEQMYRKLIHMNATRQMIPAEVRGCGNVGVSPLTPINPRGGTVGWLVAITVDVPFGGR